MSDFEEKLNAILSNPEAMGQVMNLAQSLNLGGTGSGSAETPPEDPAPDSASNQAETPPPERMPDLGSLLGQIDPDMIQRFLPLIRELSGGQNNERMQLLYALRPFLRPERRDKVEQAARAARLIHIGKKLLGTMGEGYV